MNVDIDITEELEQVIADKIKPAQLVGRCLSWNLTAGILTASNVQLANGVYGQKQVSIGNDEPMYSNKIYRAVCLAFELIEFIKKEGKRQVAPPTEPQTHVGVIDSNCPWPNGSCTCEGSKYR